MADILQGSYNDSVIEGYYLSMGASNVVSCARLYRPGIR